ncbi:hypothetical protein [Cohnella hongkongensis]|uniref:PAP2 family protein n=1 Tax=Cohnella hongkongensis TaxID=178337 RepID=A0ABV9FLZ3_9BACL
MKSEPAAYRLAHIVSFLLHPFALIVPLFMTVSVRFAPNVYEGVLCGIVVSLGAAGAPFAFIRRGVARGRWSDHDVSRREQRLVPFLYTIGSMLCTLAFLFLLEAPVELLAVFAGMICAVAAALLVTQLARWKISLHLIGITGTVLTLALLVAPFAYWLAPLIALVGWARWRVGAHTPSQALAGASLAAAVTFLVYRLFGL